MTTMTTPDPLPEIALTLEHVEFQDETWDFGTRIGLAVSINDANGEPVLRTATGWSTRVQVRPPRYQMRDVVFEIRDRRDDPNHAPRYVTQEVDVLIDPGEDRPMTPDELSEARKRAEKYLHDWLRRVVVAGQLLTPSSGVQGPSEP